MKTVLHFAVALALVAAGGLIAFGFLRQKAPELFEDRITIDRERLEAAQPSDLLADDKLADKKPAFDPALLDSRSFGSEANPWQINQSAAVYRLDIGDIREDLDGWLLNLHPSYAAAAERLASARILPSVNLVGGKAKQFDDGLYAALDLYMCESSDPDAHCIRDLVRRLMTACQAGSQAHAWLWGALEVGGYILAEETLVRPRRASSFIAEFRARSHESQVVGFYEWSPELRRAFQFLRYLQQDLAPERVLEVARGVAAVLQADEVALASYRRALAFYTRLTNPMEGLSLVDIFGSAEPVDSIARARNVAAELRFLPYSGSKETRLLRHLYPFGLTAGADLMRDFIAAIRDGRINLTPTDDGGWYDHQVYSLESFILPQVGTERDKLLLTAKYKQRLLEAFKAMVTTYRETHIRQAATAGNAAAMGPHAPEQGLEPRLRVEPNPTYFLRVARSYAFLQAFLASEIPDLNRLHGVREHGRRDMRLGDELEQMRTLFCGLHLVSCEDIGHRPQLLDGEVHDPGKAKAAAESWLKEWRKDPDLSVDTRVAVPVYYNNGASTKFWATIGVRAAPLRVSWARTPRWRPMAATDAAPEDWRDVDDWQCRDLDCLILVDEFAEFESGGTRALPRSEFRKLCDLGRSRDGILERLRD